MAFALSEHIRSLRKAHGLTQEQLAEALGVTAGAVYKWESRLMDLRHAKDLRGVDEAERAVMRYPNCFAIVYQAAVMMQVFGLEQSDKALTVRAGNRPCVGRTL